MLLVPVVEFFVPLVRTPPFLPTIANLPPHPQQTGRIGAAPADNIIATIVCSVGALGLPLILPFSHRFPRASLHRGVLMLSAVVLVLAALFAAREPFDAMHQKRIFVLHTENVTTGERSMHVAAADGAPGLDVLVGDVARVFGAGGEEGRERALVPVQMDGYNSDWDMLYPFSGVCCPSVLFFFPPGVSNTIPCSS
jgi:hypothetical protein